MDWGGPSFVIALVAVSYGAWIVNNWIRARHGYELEDEWGGKSRPRKTEESQQLKAENAALRGQIDEMQDRMVVLEKIVTDRGYSLREEIEALRSNRSENDSGVPLDIERKEKA
ncbi:MAG: hypothetical protein H6920_09685 [Sphingomonadaceae bacterium]|jgi:cell division protein FtsB|nr:hypothetical protein [Sphingomonadaceae bacterium]MCP5383251.1 hypothetical protein [Altererythrobacter sp.]MCP5391877.1 hypothetical protein [Sphingomonadaceae bacterium]MCP5393428.1 hypothetical protein [Sphingomonadaceae bacterium]